MGGPFRLSPVSPLFRFGLGHALMISRAQGGWPIFALHHSHGGCPIPAFFARACPELVEGVGGDAAGATLVRSTPPVVYAVVVPALFAYAKDGAPASVVASAV
jgi:hypothetical protein